jgi:hypothetical protein
MEQVSTPPEQYPAPASAIVHVGQYRYVGSPQYVDGHEEQVE